MADVEFDRAFREAGGVRRREPVHYPLTHESVREMAALKERVLRLQFDDDRFDAKDEAVLATLSPDDPTGCFLRYKHLVGMWHVWEHGLTRTAASKDVTAHLIMQRDPVMTRIAGRVVPITSRSRAAMIAMTRHERQRKLLGSDLERIEAMLLRPMPRRRRQFLLAAADLVSAEWEHHFRGILANAGLLREGPDTGRAALPEEVVDWWGEVSAADEARLLLALVDVGPGRYGRLGKQPPTKGEKGRESEFAFESLLATWEPKLNLPPATLANADLVQLLTWLRAGAKSSAESRELEEAFS